MPTYYEQVITHEGNWDASLKIGSIYKNDWSKPAKNIKKHTHNTLPKRPCPPGKTLKKVSRVKLIETTTSKETVYFSLSLGSKETKSLDGRYSLKVGYTLNIKVITYLVEYKCA